MTEEQKRNIRECLESQGMDPDLMRWTMARIEENEATRQAKNSKEVKRGREIMKFKPNPGTAKMTQVGETKTFLYKDDHGLPIYQEDIDMIKKALPLAKGLLKYMPRETPGNEKPLDEKPVWEMSPQERMDYWDAKEEKERQTLRTLRDTIDEAYNINPEDLNMGPDTTENINEISEEDKIHPIDTIRDSREEEGDWQPGVKFPAGAVEKGLVNPGLKYYEATGRKPETPIEKYYVREHMKSLTPEEKEHYEKLFAGTEKSMPLALDSSKILGMKKTEEDPAQDVMWYFDPESQRFKPVEDEKKINIKDYCDKMSNKKHTACPDPVFTDECAWYALNRDDNKKNITPGQWDKMTENKITEEMISNAADTTNPFTYSQILTRMHKTHERKNHDYGDAAYQGYKKFGPTYFLVQLHNKLSRLESLTAPGTETQVKDESIDDTLLDLANYAVMFLESRHRYD